MRLLIALVFTVLVFMLYKGLCTQRSLIKHEARDTYRRNSTITDSVHKCTYGHTDIHVRTCTRTQMLFGWFWVEETEGG